MQNAVETWDNHQWLASRFDARNWSRLEITSWVWLKIGSKEREQAVTAGYGTVPKWHNRRDEAGAPRRIPTQVCWGWQKNSPKFVQAHPNMRNKTGQLPELFARIARIARIVEGNSKKQNNTRIRG